MAADGLPEEASDLEFTSEFPNNPFSNVVSGEPTLLAINVTNNGKMNYTILAMAGVLVSPNNFSQVLRNLSAYRYGRVVQPGNTESMPYYFRVDIDPEDLGMVVIAEYMDANNQSYRNYAFRGTINITEQEMHFYDLQAIFLYVILIAIAVGAGYLIREQFFPSGKGRGKRGAARTVRKTEGSAPAPKVLQDEWIPEHVKNVHKAPGSTSPGKTRRRAAPAESGSKSE
ncbi:translocon-associated protein, alpha subunit [Hyaloraphidium curvatum]|nr:translocon-associated protein, alpha subunit [Hyaloraphidium curvatum]